MKNIIYTLVLVLTAVTSVKAQQVQQYTQYLFNSYAFNPAVGGSTPDYEIKTNHRYQWVGFTDAPRTFVFSGSGLLRNEKMGVGGTVFTDIVGPTRRTAAHLSYSYHLTLSESMKLSFGVSGGVMQFLIDGAKVTTRDDGDEAFSNGIMSVIVPDANAGLYLYSDKLSVGFSTPQLIPVKLKYFSDYEDTEGKMVNHFYLFGAYKISATEDIIIEPSALVKYASPTPPQIDGSLRVFYKNMIWAGASYRTQDAIAFMIGATLKQNLSFGYSYDLIQSSIKNYSTGTHELMLGLKIARNSKPKTAAPSLE